MTNKTLIAPIIERAKSDPNQLALIFIAEDGSVEEITTSDFHAGAMAFAWRLERLGLSPGDLVVLVARHSKALIYAFWGAMYLGAIPSILPYLTEKLNPQLYFERIRTLVENSGAKAVVSSSEFHGELQTLLAGVECQVLSMDDISQIPAGFSPAWKQSGETLAFLQYSSGTTGLQKGVALSHHAVLNQIQAYSEAIKLNDQDVIVSWLPLYHDMGLIAGFVMPVVAGIPLVLMSPFSWVRNPVSLLKAIDTFNGTLCWLPNFAYNHCARAIRKRDLDGLDLSRWRMVINCSEPARHDSHEMFLKKLALYGFAASALAVSYAMAENTFAVTQSPANEKAHVDWVKARALQESRKAIPTPANAPGSLPVVSCGYPLRGCKVAIIDEEGHQLPDRHIGEIILHSNSMLTGYHARPEITALAIRDGWYLTGDLGYLAEGQLYVSGRKKDLIIVGGKNIYPQDLEAIATSIPGIRPGRTVAFGWIDTRLGTEAIIMVSELINSEATPQKRQETEQEVRRRIVEQTEVTLHDFRLVEKQWLVKTSSGKIARIDNKEKYLREFKRQ
jgi:acyl-CoA synthetase (AMP-forming)/AMP-acid ligase II